MYIMCLRCSQCLCRKGGVSLLVLACCKHKLCYTTLHKQTTYKVMFRKKSSLNVRPEPPTFAEISQDINSADSNDVVFLQTDTGTDSVYVSEGSGTTEPVTLATQSDAQRTLSSSTPPSRTPSDTDTNAATPAVATVDQVYQQAKDFITFTEQLKLEMAAEQDRQKSLGDACREVTATLDAMKRTVADLRAHAANAIHDNVS